MSSNTPWKVLGRPSRSRSNSTASSRTHTMWPSFARYRASTLKDSPVVWDRSVAAKTRVRSSGWSREVHRSDVPHSSAVYPRSRSIWGLVYTIWSACCPVSHTYVTAGICSASIRYFRSAARRSSSARRRSAISRAIISLASSSSCVRSSTRSSRSSRVRRSSSSAPFSSVMSSCTPCQWSARPSRSRTSVATSRNHTARPSLAIKRYSRLQGLPVSLAASWAARVCSRSSGCRSSIQMSGWSSHSSRA